MGWSCSAKAGAVLNAWQKACTDNSNMSNVFQVKGVRFMFEVSSKEHDDGAITGKILKFVSDTHVVSHGSFRIEPDGTVTRGGSFLTLAAKQAKPVMGGIGSGG